MFSAQPLITTLSVELGATDCAAVGCDKRAMAAAIDASMVLFICYSFQSLHALAGRVFRQILCTGQVEVSTVGTDLSFAESGERLRLQVSGVLVVRTDSQHIVGQL